ncbi:MAG TPA: hypothetical protein V6D11_18390 [Waterburya sp.]|jgi:hypothetical protein
MKSKFYGLLTASLATSVLLTSVQETFAHSAEPQANVKESSTVVQDVNNRQEASRTSAQTQKVGQEAQAVADNSESGPLSATSQTQESIPANVSAQTDQVSNTVGGLAVTFVFMTYILIGLMYRRRRAHRAAILVQQIETLERIWKMEPYR